MDGERHALVQAEMRTKGVGVGGGVLGCYDL